MSAVQYPRRRESDEAARRRVELLEERRRARDEATWPLPKILARLVSKPRISSSGRLIP